MCWGKKSNLNTNGAPFNATNVINATQNRDAIETGGTASVGGWRGATGGAAAPAGTPGGTPASPASDLQTSTTSRMSAGGQPLGGGEGVTLLGGTRRVA